MRKGRVNPKVPSDGYARVEAGGVLQNLPRPRSRAQDPIGLAGERQREYLGEGSPGPFKIF